MGGIDGGVRGEEGGKKEWKIGESRECKIRGNDGGRRVEEDGRRESEGEG